MTKLLVKYNPNLNSFSSFKGNFTSYSIEIYISFDTRHKFIKINDNQN